MVPCCKIPTPITALYVFAIINLTVLLNITLVEANVLLLNSQNHTLGGADDLPARFGPELSSDGIYGHVIHVVPHEGCGTIHRPPPKTHGNWIALIKRNGCDFDEKVWNAQRAGYTAAIVYNYNSDKLVPMGRGKHGGEVNISSVFIGESDAKWLAHYSNKTDFWVVLNNSTIPPFDLGHLIRDALIFGGSTMGLAIIIGWIVMIVKWVRDARKKRRSRLSLAHLKKLPVKKFKKGDPYDVCAICLDEYEDGDKLRILPCSHAYHQKCIDPWLTKNKRTCPICKRKVIPGDDQDSGSESDSDDGGATAAASENTPLLGATGGADLAVGGNTFDNNSGPPDAMRTRTRNIPDSDTSDDDNDLPQSTHQSSVEVHGSSGDYGSRGRTGGNRGYGALATVSMANETINGDDSSNDDDTDDDDDAVSNHRDSDRLLGNRPRGNRRHGNSGGLGAVAGAANPSFDVIEDHFGGDGEDPEMRDNDVISSASEAGDEDIQGAQVRVVGPPPPTTDHGKKGAEIV